MSHILRVGVADQIAYFRAYNTDGSAKTDLTSSTTGLLLSVFRIGLLPTSILTLSNKAADNTAHADGAIRNVGGNLYTVDIPDAACATQCPSIVVRGTYTGGVIEGLEHPIVAYDPSLAYQQQLWAAANSTVNLSGTTIKTATDIETDTVDIQSSVSQRPTLTQIESSTVLAKQNTLTTGVSDILNAVGNIEVDNQAIAEAVEAQLADDFAAITENIDNETISQLVFQSIVGSGLAKYSIPQVTGTIEAVKYADLELSIPASTASDSILYLSIGCENHTTPNLQADSTDGLTILNQLEDFDPADVTVQRTSPTVVDVWISARVLSKLTAADYLIALTEITTDNKTKLRFEKCFTVRSGVGRIIG